MTERKKPYGSTRSRVDLTEVVIERMAREAGVSADVTKFYPRPPPRQVEPRALWPAVPPDDALCLRGCGEAMDCGHASH